MGNSKSKRSTESSPVCLTSKYDDIQIVGGGTVAPVLTPFQTYRGLDYTGYLVFKPASTSAIQALFSKFFAMVALLAAITPPQPQSPPNVATLGVVSSLTNGQLSVDLLPSGIITPATGVESFTPVEFYGGCPLSLLATAIAPVRCSVVAEGKRLDGESVEQEFEFAPTSSLRKKTFGDEFRDLVELRFTLTEGGPGGLLASDTVFLLDSFKHCNKLT